MVRYRPENGDTTGPGRLDLQKAKVYFMWAPIPADSEKDEAITVASRAYV